MYVQKFNKTSKTVSVLGKNRTEQNRNSILTHKHIGLMVTAIQYKACNICDIFQYTNIEKKMNNVDDYFSN